MRAESESGCGRREAIMSPPADGLRSPCLAAIKVHEVKGWRVAGDDVLMIGDGGRKWHDA